jgi:M6 family metalloprotease-like protein
MSRSSRTPMPRIRFCVAATFAILVVLLSYLSTPRPSGSTTPTTLNLAPPGYASREAHPPSPDSTGLNSLALHRDEARTTADSAFERFEEWRQRYLAAEENARRGMEAEGVSLAIVRRAALRDTIVRDPRRALLLAMAPSAREDLPAAVVAQMETPVSGRGDLAVQCALPSEGSSERPFAQRHAFVGGTNYVAHVYGRRESQNAKYGVSLHGIALDGHLAVHESPLRSIESREAAAHFPVEAFGEPQALSSSAEVETLERQLIRAEALASPYVLRPDEAELEGTPARAAARTKAWSTGLKRVLVIRVDFSDLPGEPMSAATAKERMDSVARPFFEQASHGATTLESTVSAKVYRLPRSAASYANADDYQQLHADARALAGADHALANYDRLMVFFARVAAPQFPNSSFGWGGKADVGGERIWINGAANYTLRVVGHELGHTYGFQHANLWKATDGNPVSAQGTSVEYGDPFDIMGEAQATDARHHFNPHLKHLAGWLPDSAVTTVERSGTYRIFRFDGPAALSNRVLALRIYRDGVRWYWVGLRQNFSGNPALTNGAYIVWGHNSTQQTQLLNPNPGGSTEQAALAVGATFVDADHGIRIKALARGGSEPEQYLDVEVTVPETRPQSLSAWGAEGVTFFEAGSGIVRNPAPETSVPQGMGELQALAAGNRHVLAMKRDGTLVAWGDNAQGQTTIPAGLGSIRSIAAGGNVSGVVLADGTVRLWGAGTDGTLQPPAGLSGVRQLAIGGSGILSNYHALALKDDGTVVAWGSNLQGQRSVPAGLTNVVAIAASYYLSVALKADGTVVRWGATFVGAVPFPTGLSGVAAIASSGGASHALALRKDGTVVGWGANNFGQSEAPAGLNNVVAIATGGFHSLALTADGRVVAWGYDANGQLEVPVQQPRGFALAAGDRASFLLTGPHVYIASQPSGQTVALGGGVTLSTAATGAGELTYQWRKDGVPIAGATKATLTVSGVRIADVGSYDVVIRDAANSRISFPVELTVRPDFGRLANLSILTGLETGEVLTMGFVVGGEATVGSKPLLVRAVGPSLAALGVPGILPDPRMELFAGGSRIAENDNWGGSATLRTAMASVGAFPLAETTSRDSVIVTNLARRDYSVKISGVGAAAGTVIAELYDSSGPAFTAVTPRLINVSVLKQIGAGLTTGFVVDGVTPVKVLVRAIGPTLGEAPFNVPDVLKNPQLALFRDGTKLAENDDWGGGPSLVTASASVGAFPIPSTSLDAALIVTLAPGSYTAQVSGVGGTTGVALVEVYEVP